MKNMEENIIEKTLIARAWENAYQYEGYRNLVDEFATEGKTTGKEQKPGLIEYRQSIIG